MAGLPVPIVFNDGVNVYAPKGEETGDSEEVVRAASDTRPLSLKNSDNKITGGTIQMSLKVVLQVSASKLQRGFVKGRVLTNNIVDLDGAARVHSMEPGQADDAGTWRTPRGQGSQPS